MSGLLAGRKSRQRCIYKINFRRGEEAAVPSSRVKGPSDGAVGRDPQRQGSHLLPSPRPPCRRPGGRECPLYSEGAEGDAGCLQCRWTERQRSPCGRPRPGWVRSGTAGGGVHRVGARAPSRKRSPFRHGSGDSPAHTFGGSPKNGPLHGGGAGPATLLPWASGGRPAGSSRPKGPEDVSPSRKLFFSFWL